MAVISLTTDFGFKDPFVGVMKGVILQINPQAIIVDLCHRVSPGNVLEAALIINSAYRYFPESSIHLVVVDPGVGSERRPLVAKIGQYYFVCPDNGVLSYIYQDYVYHPRVEKDQEAQKETRIQVFHAINIQYVRPQISKTFHGRDIFAPLAAWLSTGLREDAFGPKIDDYVNLEIPKPRLLGSGRFEFQIIHIDNFGNLITSINEDFFQQANGAASNQSFSISIAAHCLNHIYTHYAALPETSKLGVLFGSTGNLEIFANQDRADQILGIKVGDRGILSFGNNHSFSH